MGERYYLGVYWGHRAESVDACAARALAVLAGLRELEPALFPRWYVWRETKEASLEHPVDESLAGLRDLLRIPRHEPDGPRKPDIDPGGFALELWNGAPTPELTCRFEMTTGVHHGAWNAPAPNDCEVMLPLAPAKELLEPARLGNLLARLARDADADWGMVTTNDHLLANGASREPGSPLVGWLVFLAATRGRAAKKLPPHASAAVLEGLGTLYTASPPPFDWGTADALRDALEKARLLHPTGATPAQPSAASEHGDAYEAALDLAVLAQELSDRARGRAGRAEELLAAAAALVVEQTQDARSRVSSLLDLAHRLGAATDEDRDAIRALLERVAT